jgi:hypothetical protein
MDFKKMQKIELAKSGKLHAEAWQHRMKGEFDLMIEKQNDAMHVVRLSKTYEYLNMKYGTNK